MAPKWTERNEKRAELNKKREKRDAGRALVFWAALAGLICLALLSGCGAAGGMSDLAATTMRETTAAATAPAAGVMDDGYGSGGYDSKDFDSGDYEDAFEVADAYAQQSASAAAADSVQAGAAGA
ncbi:MAG: hypothetical protein LBU58_12195, partial [Clostridiales bacterium]|nr:hypothetical protein [Clostridiales bacterium]